MKNLKVGSKINYQRFDFNMNQYVNRTAVVKKVMEYPNGTTQTFITDLGDNSRNAISYQGNLCLSIGARFA